MGKDLLTLLEEDVARCEEAIKNGNSIILWDLYNSLYPKYLKVVEGLNYGTQNHITKALQNVIFIKEKLELYMATLIREKEIESSRQSLVSINNTNNNSNSMNFNVTFTYARSKIENMTSLAEKEIKEVLEKVDELEKIVESQERRSSKWEKASDIIKWIADKGVDVGIALLPLLLQI